MRTRLSALSLSLYLTLVALPALAAESYFQGWDVPDDPAGWTANTVGTDVAVVNVGGNPGGYLASSRPASGNSIGTTTEIAEASGDYGAAGVFQVSFDVEYLAGDFFSAAFRVRYQDATFNGWYFPLPADFTPGWKSYVIPIDPTWSDADAMAAGWVRDDPGVESFATTLSDVYHPEVRIDGFGALTAGIDNFRIRTCVDPVTTLSAGFDADVPGSAPDLTLPGAPAGDALYLSEISGTIRVESAVGTLVNQPVEIVQEPGISDLALVATMNDTEPCGLVRFTWSSLAESEDIFFLGIVIRDGSGLILGSVEYRPGGDLTYNSNAGNLPVPVAYVPNVHQDFEILVDTVNRTTSLSIDGAPMAGLQNLSYVEAGAGLPARLGFEAGGIDAQAFAVDDIAAVTCDCTCDTDSALPTIDVVLSRDVLWPPNHKMAEVCAEITVSDNCDSDPVVALVSVTSDEPDNGLGDGDTDGDIEVLEGDPPTCFNLRSERQGGGDGRKYTIIYSVTDASGNAAYDTVCVVVPHDQGGHASAATGIAPAGGGLMPNAGEFAVVITSEYKFSPETVVPERSFIGNHLGYLAPTRSYKVDVNADAVPDLALFYDASAARVLLDRADAEVAGATSLSGDDLAISLESNAVRPTPLGLRYETRSGRGYLAGDIFRLGSRVKLPDGPAEGRQVVGAGDLDLGRDPALATAPQAGRVVVQVFNVLGQRIRTLIDRDLEAGSFSVAWDGRDDAGRQAPAGIYFTRIAGPGVFETRRAVVVR